MANELQSPKYLTGRTVYVIVRRLSDGAAWNGSAFEALLTAHWSTYKIAATEQSTTGWYYATMPAGVSAAGLYAVTWFVQAAGSPAATDAAFGGATLDWNGSKDCGLNVASVDGKTPLEAFAYVAAATAGECSGGGTGTVTFTGLDGATDRITATVDSSGNRTGVTYG